MIVVEIGVMEVAAMRSLKLVPWSSVTALNVEGSGRRDNASATTFCLPLMYSIV